MNNPEGIKALVVKLESWMDSFGDCLPGEQFRQLAEIHESLTAVAGDTEAVAREMLAAELDAIRFPATAAEIRDPGGQNTLGAAMVRVLARALSTRQAVEGMVLVPRDALIALQADVSDHSSLAYERIRAWLAAAAPQAGKGES